MIPGLAHWLSTGPIASTLPVEWTSRFPVESAQGVGDQLKVQDDSAWGAGSADDHPAVPGAGGLGPEQEGDGAGDRGGAICVEGGGGARGGGGGGGGAFRDRRWQDEGGRVEGGALGCRRSYNRQEG